MRALTDTVRTILLYIQIYIAPLSHNHCCPYRIILQYYSMVIETAGAATIRVVVG